MTLEEAKQITGGLSQTSAMPCPSYSLSAKECKTGSKLAKVKGTTCSICYARRGRYQFPNVRNKQSERLQSLQHPQWVQAMALLVRDSRYFRWHDSGDVQSVEHFRKICGVARLTPHTLHWLPTKEKSFLVGNIPENLVVRLSLTKIDEVGKPRRYLTSSVVTKNSSCLKHDAKNCGTCRDCWDKSISHITYRKY